MAPPRRPEIVIGLDVGKSSHWVKKADAPRGGNPFQAAEENRRLKRVSVNAFFTIWGYGGNPGPFRVRRSAPNPSDTASGSCSPGRFLA